MPRLARHNARNVWRSQSQKTYRAAKSRHSTRQKGCNDKNEHSHRTHINPHSTCITLAKHKRVKRFDEYERPNQRHQDHRCKNCKLPRSDTSKRAHCPDNERLNDAFRAEILQHFDHRNRRLDSLERILAVGTPTDEALILIHRDLMWGYREIDIEKSMYHALKQVETAMPRGDLRAVSDGYGGLGVGHYYLAQYDSALVYYAKGLEVAERMRELPETYRRDDVDSDFAFLNGSIGNVHNIQGDYHRAIEHYQRALAIFEHHDWRESQAIAYCNIGEMYKAMDNWERAEATLKTCCC